MINCRICNKPVQKLLDLGPLPVCHRFVKSPDEKEVKHDFILGSCRSCGLVQLIDPFPQDYLKPVYDWITYREPEAHLDKLTGLLSRLLPDKGIKICGVSFKDDSTLDRLNRLGFHNTIRLDIIKDLGGDIPWGGVETVQKLLTSGQAKKICKLHGKFDLIIARHIFEHVYNVPEFIKGIKKDLLS